MTTEYIYDTAAALLTGGWDAEDKDDFAEMYNLTAEEAEEIAEEMRRQEA